MLQKEKIKKEKIQQQQRDLEAQQRELEKLQAEKELRVAKARLDVYKQEAARESISSPEYSTENRHADLTQTATNQRFSFRPTFPQVDVSQLAQAFQDSISLNRLPMPEPYVINGDPIQYLKWKSSFVSLIDRKGISSADKLYNLERYVSGPAHKSLDGTFFKNYEEAYKDAWNKLNRIRSTIYHTEGF